MKSHVSPERARHLERNRIAANKCRERKKREHKLIERRLSDETEKKEILLAQLNVLREEVWDLKNIIFQHAECDDHQINSQLARMTQSVLSHSVDSTSPTSQTWSEEDANANATGNELKMEGAFEECDWSLPPTNDFYDPILTDSMFENFIQTDNPYS
ncbi:unnamed protein product [Penicillium salamii]|uniref:BZIP domain-containing protein n=1 Tax=Penicillium salamii TaxID=1612424 RepID=A0A9W4NLN5_9EURO|nr:unnamed protein product [Penicillium salamii]CAG8192027.1 unnamed protein product [Penicillium salamii]CAG8284221.1 unnamed protein product [Penicillium salamii]CAG8296022.1 unnamed protein product [Penicillium salamii]CAG8374915.1 unnamed protein product [Penicillium salamii]